ncbi:hypothetical protein HY571_01195 [Candidatus Micrarchaeota archaeon]|nr:hypothetical protein [Candidatus Micrarchaeota archaeon]
MNKRCPSCGREEFGEEFVRNFCPDCFAKNFSLAEVPVRIEITRCTVCSKIKCGNDWLNENKKTITDVIAGKIKSSNYPVVTRVDLRESTKGFDATVCIVYRVEGREIVQNYSIRIDFQQTQCLECSRKTGGYYDAIIQVRSKDPGVPNQFESKLKNVGKLLEQRGGRIMKIQETKTGPDIYVAGITPAMQAAHLLGEKVKHTRKLIGRKNGKDLYRHTFCIRF